MLTPIRHFCPRLYFRTHFLDCALHFCVLLSVNSGHPFTQITSCSVQLRLEPQIQTWGLLAWSFSEGFSHTVPGSYQEMLVEETGHILFNETDWLLVDSFQEDILMLSLSCGISACQTVRSKSTPRSVCLRGAEHFLFKKKKKKNTPWKWAAAGGSLALIVSLDYILLFKCQDIRVERFRVTALRDILAWHVDGYLM